MVIGIVGRARWGGILAEIVKKDPRVERVVMRGRSWEDLLDSRLSGVMVACPPAHHVEVARPFLEAGVPLFIEKPLALSRADAESLAEIAALRPRVPILVDHLLLFSELYAPIRDRVQSVLASGGSVDRLSITWTGDRRRDDVSPLWDYGSHVVAVALDLLGPSVSFAWTGARGSHGMGVSSFTIQDGERERGSVETGCVREGREPYRSISLTTTEGGRRTWLQWNETRKELQQFPEPARHETTPPLTHAVTAFLDAIEGKPDHRLGLELGVRVVSKLAGLERAASRE